MAQQVFDWIKTNLPTIGWIIAVCSIFIEFTPIKINPLSSLFKWIGKSLTGNACSKIDGLIQKVDKIEDSVMENEKDRIRWEIFDFARSCRNKEKHSKEEFEHILTLNKKYEKLLQQTNDSNGVFEIEFKYIQKIYTERLEENDFLA